MAVCAMCGRPVVTKMVVLDDGAVCHPACRYLPPRGRHRDERYGGAKSVASPWPAKLKARLRWRSSLRGVARRRADGVT
jgi:hypothetical protein